MTLKEVVITSGNAIRRTRSEVPDYLQRAISESVERGKHDARRAAATEGGRPDIAAKNRAAR